MSKNGCCQECPGLATLELESPLDGGTTLKGSKGGSRSRRALSHRGSARGNGLSGPLQLRLRPETRRQVPPPDRGHRPRPLDPAIGASDSRIPEVARPLLGRGTRRFRSPRSLPPERAVTDLPPARRGAPEEGPCLSVLLHSGEARRDEGRARRIEGLPRLRPPLPGDSRRVGRGESPSRPSGPSGEEPRGPDEGPRRGGLRVPGSPPRRDTQGLDLDRRSGDPQVRRLSHLPPGERGRRPPHGDKPRDPGRGVVELGPQAREALRVLRLGAADLLPPAASTKQRSEQDQALEAQEPDVDPLLPARPLSPPSHF